MKKTAKKFLYDLIETPSPSGYEEPIQKLVKKYASDFADSIESDLHGNLIAGLNTKAKKRVMIAGHCDHIGFMVLNITKEGYLNVAPLGGIDFGVVPGSRATVHTAKGPVNAIFGRKPIHLQDLEERGTMKLGEKENWLDIGAKDQAQAEKLVAVGDPVTFELTVTELENNLISAPGLDDRAGCFVAFEALKRCADKKLDVAVFAVSTVQEEVGLRGAITASYKVDPEVGIAIDVTHSTDNPGADKEKFSPIHLGKGPAVSRGLNTSPVVEKRLIDAAKKAKITVQTDLCPRPGGNDTSAIQVSRGGKATASIGIPCRYMHTKSEVVSVDDIDASADLIVEFIANIKSNTSFLPY